MKKLKLEGEKKQRKTWQRSIFNWSLIWNPKGRIFPCHSSSSFDSLSFDNLAEYETEIFARKSFQDGRRVRRRSLSSSSIVPSSSFFSLGCLNLSLIGPILPTARERWWGNGGKNVGMTRQQCDASGMENHKTITRLQVAPSPTQYLNFNCSSFHHNAS